MTLKKTVLFFDERKYAKDKNDLEREIPRLWHALTGHARQCLGSQAKIDFKALREDPASYLSQQYWDLYANLRFPDTMDKLQVFTRDTGVTPRMLSDLKKNLDAIEDRLGPAFPELKKEQVTFELDKEAYKVTLPPDKEEFYNDTLALVEVLNELHEKYSYREGGHVGRWNDAVKFDALAKKFEINPKAFLRPYTGPEKRKVGAAQPQTNKANFTRHGVSH